MEFKFSLDNPPYEYVTDYSHGEEVLKKLATKPVLGLDIESTGLDPYTTQLLLVQIGDNETSYIFDARALDLKQLPLLKEICESTKIIKLMQNGKFDYGFLAAQVDIRVNNIYDTMLAESLLSAGMRGKPASLKELCSIYLGVDLDKTIRKSFAGYTGKITEEQLRYSALDTLLLFPIFEMQSEKLKKENLLNIAKLEFAVTRVVADMELKGIHIDVPKWKGIINNLSVKRDKHMGDFYEAIRPYYQASQVDLFGVASEPININSQVQLMDLFNSKLKLNIPATGDAILEAVDHPVAKILREYRTYEKLISAFGDSLLEKVNPKTGRIHPDFQQLGTATGRFSCRNPNLQQIPQKSAEVPFRECFTPAEGYMLVVTDYSSMEMRILADLSGDEMLVKAIKEGYDLHSHTASLMFNLEYSSDFKKKYPQQRQDAKAINFGLVYGMGAGGLARQIGKTPDEAKDLMERYFKNYPRIKRWLETTGAEAVKNGWSSTPAGRKRWYHPLDPMDPDYKKNKARIEREAKNHPIQGTNADITKYAMVFLQDRIKRDKVDGSVILTVHDEVVCEIREDQAEEWAKIQQAEMIRAAELIVKRVPIASEPFVGKVWEH